MPAVGGVAALYLAAAYLIGMALFLVVLDYPSITDPAQKVTQAILAQKARRGRKVNLAQQGLRARKEKRATPVSQAHKGQPVKTEPTAQYSI